MDKLLEYNADVNAPTTIDLWSDFVCPYCYIGLRRLDARRKTVATFRKNRS